MLHLDKTKETPWRADNENCLIVGGKNPLHNEVGPEKAKERRDSAQISALKTKFIVPGRHKRLKIVYFVIFNEI